MRVALLLIDIQNDYFPGGRMELVGAEEAVHHASRLLSYFRAHRLPVVHVQHLAVRPGATFFLPNTPGAEIHTVVAPNDHEAVIQKHYPNSFRDTALASHLAEHAITHLVVAGMMTHMCVDATVRAAVDAGFECRIVSDACATRTLTFDGTTVDAPAVHAAFLAALNGTYGRVMAATEALAGLDGTTQA